MASEKHLEIIRQGVAAWNEQVGRPGPAPCPSLAARSSSATNSIGIVTQKVLVVPISFAATLTSPRAIVHPFRWGAGPPPRRIARRR